MVGTGHFRYYFFIPLFYFRAFAEGCGFCPRGRFMDPKIACWMLDPSAKEKTLHRMVTNLLPTEVHMLHGNYIYNHTTRRKHDGFEG